MKESKDHLNIDLEFLDKKEPVRVAPKKPEPPKGNEPNWRFYNPNNVNSKSGKQYKWKNILIVGGIILFIGWAIFSDSGSSSTSSSNSTYSPPSGSNNLLSEGGHTFRCSDSNYNKAIQLKPSISMGAQLANESDGLDARITANKAEKASLDGMYVDENDQYEVDSYNSRVDSYNAERQRLMTAANSWDQKSKAFDSQIDTYNNFLDTNCTPQ
jgi:hypothetical protein